MQIWSSTKSAAAAQRIVVIVFASTTCAAKSIDAIGRDCASGQPKACAELRRIATTSKNIKDRLAAIPFIPDASTLTAVVNDATQKPEVIAAASARMEQLKRQAQAHDEELRRQAQARAEQQKKIMPRVQDIEMQVAVLSSYKTGVTTLDEFYADGWDAADALLTKLGIVSARYDGPHKTVDFDIGYYGDYDKKASAEAVLSVVKFVDDGFRVTRDMDALGTHTGVSEWHAPPLFESATLQITLTDVDGNYPRYHLQFTSGRLSTITKTDVRP